MGSKAPYTLGHVLSSGHTEKRGEGSFSGAKTLTKALPGGHSPGGGSRDVGLLTA